MLSSITMSPRMRGLVFEQLSALSIVDFAFVREDNLLTLQVDAEWYCKH